MKEFKVLSINMGSTSTKIALYKNEKELFSESIRYSVEELSEFSTIYEQYNFRKQTILNALELRKIELEEIDCISSRGGTIKPVEGGTYIINQQMIDDSKSGKYGTHSCNLGVMIAMELGNKYDIPALTVDPPTVDEMCMYAKYSGVPEIPRLSSFHALNHKATARKASFKLGKDYTDINLIVCHLGGGISVGVHEKGKIVDVNNALEGDGPMSPERAGTVPAGGLIRMCFSGKYNEKEMIAKVNGKGGLIAYLGTTSGIEIESRIKSGDNMAREIFETMAFQISKSIGAAAAVLNGNVEAIVLTGSLAYSERLVDIIKERVGFIAQLLVFAGENEMKSLTEGALRYLNGEEEAKIYQ